MMSFKNLFKLSILELLRYKAVSLFLVLNLTLGLVGFFTLQIFQQSLSLQSAEKAQSLLGGDLSIYARRKFSSEEREKWEATFSYEKKSHFYYTFSMFRYGDDSRLTSVGMFDEQHPIYGQYKLSDIGFTDDKPRVWVDPEVSDMFGLKLGDKVRIGEMQFEYSGEILEDPTRFLRIANFAPVVLIHIKYLDKAQLIKPGSTFTEYWNYSLSKQQNLAQVKSTLEKIITDQTVRIQTTHDSQDDSNRVLQYFTDYLGLVALVALSLCFLCGSYLLQWVFLSKKKTIAIYKTMGLSDKKIIFNYLLQNTLISLVSCVLSYIVVQSLLPILQELITVKFNLPIKLFFSFNAVFITSLLAVLGPILIVVPQILQIMNLKPLMLLQNNEGVTKKTSAHYIWLLFSVMVFWALSAWMSHSYKVASIFTASLVGLIFVFQSINWILLESLENLSHHFSWITRYSIKGLSRKKSSAGLVFTTMSLATLVLSLLPHVKSSIISEVSPQDVTKMPNLFMFDIQPDQVDALQALASKILKQQLVLSPLVRSRILKVNDENYERVVRDSEIQTREQDAEARFRNRGINLTYRDHLQDSEKVIKGEFSGIHKTEEAYPQISIEKRYAERVNLKMGDVVTFDIQGVEVKAQVNSIRQVRWTSFQPNFFILFPTNVLEEAPQIFLTSVSHPDKKIVKDFQKTSAENFKNVSIIDVSRTIELTTKYIEQMSIGLQFMAWLAVMVGLFVFIVLLNTQIRERLQEMNLLQIMGSKLADVFKIVLSQFILLISISVIFGVFSGLLVAWIILSYFFDITTVYDIKYLFVMIAVLLPVCGGALYWGLKPLKSLKPMDLIRQT